ncbi:MAG: leucine-rich repeat domain-containing protein, partial [Clostridia bacterium]|nr:leucine-rich repeat domain-containing protein [Clostridia bacterium]
WLNAGTDKLSVAVECGEGTILERIILPDGFLPYVGETAGTAIEIGDTYESTNFPLSDEECCGWFVDAEYSEVLDFGDIEIETDELIVEPEPLKIYTAEASDTSNFIFALNSDGTSYNVKASGTSISGTIVLPAKYDNGTNGLLPVTSTYAATSSSTGAFFNCKSMTKLVVNSNMTSIGNYAFQYCSKLTTINIPDSVTSIGSSAFLSCSGLTEINISTSVESIGKQAFYSCSGLTEINIPDSVTSIGSSAFHYCTGLTSITVSSENTVYDSRENCNAIIETASNTLIQGCKNSSIPASVTSIGDSAFRYCSKLTTINIPDSVTSIGSSAFHYCTGLTGVTIGSGVTSIGDDAFEYCTSLTSITVSSENTVYDSRENCNAIIETASNTLIQGCKNTIIPASVTSIGDSAFYRCTSLTDINIPYGVTNIGESAFEYCTGLTSVNIPDSVTSIGNGAFFYCTSLTDINIPDSVTSIGSQAFYSCSGLTEINITNGVTNIGESAFEYCTGLTHIFVPSTVTTISASGYYNSPFYGCSSSLVIYTDVANASSKPSRWGTYWYYYGSNKTLTVKYGYSRENYEIEVGLREPGPSVTLVPYIDGEPQSAIDCIIGTAYDDIAFPLTDEQCVGWFLDPEYTQVFDPTALTEEDVGT